MLDRVWEDILLDEYSAKYFLDLENMLKTAYISKTIFPIKENIFNALKMINYNDVKVVIIGQDPYHGTGEAQGLSFSVPTNIKRPPSLRNIFKELYYDLGISRENNDLTDWAKQGVLLLNSILTVEKDKPLSHKNIGWEMFTDNIMKKLNKRETPIVFILWGNYARSKKSLITNDKHLVIESAHPSPFSANRGFFGSKPFSKTNKFLEDNEMKGIRW
jgi:uracil-DNA glycosylase